MRPTCRLTRALVSLPSCARIDGLAASVHFTIGVLSRIGGHLTTSPRLHVILGQGAHETGLGNELWALAGYLLLAFTRNHTLCLPPFTTNAADGHGEGGSVRQHGVSVTNADAETPCTRTKRSPFADVFDAEAFIAGMSRVGVRCYPPPQGACS